MDLVRKIRRIAAVVLVCSIFLPLSQCARHDEGVNPPSQKAVAHARHLFPRSDADFEYQYAIKNLDFSLRGALTLVAFFWPLPFLWWDAALRRKRFWWLFVVLELLLCAGTIYWVDVTTMEGRWLYGAYVAESAIAIYAATIVWLAIGEIRERRLEGAAVPRPPA
jgi:hypothetical protein